MTEDTSLLEIPSQTVEWKIENFSLLPKNNNYLDSPYFSLSGINWHLRFYPYRYESNDISGSIHICLVKEKTDVKYLADYKIGLKNANAGSVPSSKFEYIIFSENLFGCGEPVCFSRLFLQRLQDTLLCSNDTLIVACTIRNLNQRILSWNKEDEPQTSLTLTEKAFRILSLDNSINISKGLKELYLNKRFTDFTFDVKGRKFLVHRNILAARSSVFAAMFQRQINNGKNGRIEIPDFDPDTFEDFLLFLYSGKFDSVTSSNAISLYKISEKYEVQTLKKECVWRLIHTVTVDTFCDVLDFAKKYNVYELIKAARYFYHHNSEEIIKTLKWRSYMSEKSSFVTTFLSNTLNYE